MNDAEKKKIDRAKYIIEKQNDKTIYKHFGEVAGFNFKIRGNNNCTIYILDYCSGMFVDDCIDCKIITGPIDGSIFIRTSKNCSISTITRQLRFRDCENIKTFTYCPSDPAVESSFNIYFAPYNVFFPHLTELFTKAKFTQTEPNHISTPYDFTVDKVMGGGAKHFLPLPQEEFIIEQIPDGDDKCEEMFEGYSNSEEWIKEQIEQNKLQQRKEDNNDYNYMNQQQQRNELDDYNYMNQQPQQGNDYQDDYNYLNQQPQQTIPQQTIPQQRNDYQDDYNYLNQQPQQTIPQQRNDYQDDYNYLNQQPQQSKIPFQAINQQELDDDMKREQQRQKEAEERATKIREKINYELQAKNELRNKAFEFLNTFKMNHQKQVENNKSKNSLIEANNKKEKEQLTSNSGNQINYWEKTTENISIKSSEYKGSKDISRMRECIINRKNDYKEGSNLLN